MAVRAVAIVGAVDDEFFGTGPLRATAVDVLRQLAGRDADGNITDARWPRSN
jgi:hypothetical protein